MQAVEEVMRSWDDGPVSESDRSALIRAVARTEFGRRGYEATTVRDIAGAAQMSTGSVYREIGSKEELLVSIMRSFSEKVVAGWDAALTSSATSVQKLDAVAWLQINVLERFHDEFKIQLAWLRQSPPDTPDMAWSFPEPVAASEGDVEGGRSGWGAQDRGSLDRAHCPFDRGPHLGTRRHPAHLRQADRTHARPRHHAARCSEAELSRSGLILWAITRLVPIGSPFPR